MYTNPITVALRKQFADDEALFEEYVHGVGGEDVFANAVVKAVNMAFAEWCLTELLTSLSVSVPEAEPFDGTVKFRRTYRTIDWQKAWAECHPTNFFHVKSGPWPCEWFDGESYLCKQHENFECSPAVFAQRWRGYCDSVGKVGHASILFGDERTVVICAEDL